MILIDTDILIHILRNNTEYINLFKDAVSKNPSDIYITPIQIVEILAGVRKKEKINTELFLNSLEVISIDKNIGILAGEYMNQYMKSHRLQSADSIIAATSKKHNLKLWTNNKKHYPMFSKLEFYI